MGVIIDIILVVIILLSAFLGYKKGLVKLGANLFAGIIAIILTIILYRPVSGMIIKNTGVDEKVKEAIIQNTTKVIVMEEQMQNVTNQMEKNLVSKEAENISKKIVCSVTALVLFVFIKVLLSIVISLMDFVANLPVLKQFNEVGGIVYGLVRGILITCVCILFMGVYIKINPESELNYNIESSYLTKVIYKTIIK